MSTLPRDWALARRVGGACAAQRNQSSEQCQLHRELARCAGKASAIGENVDKNEKLLGWLKDNVPQDAVIAGQNPALVNLYTGLKGVGSTEPSRYLER